MIDVRLKPKGHTQNSKWEWTVYDHFFVRFSIQKYVYCFFTKNVIQDEIFNPPQFGLQGSKGRYYIPINQPQYRFFFVVEFVQVWCINLKLYKNPFNNINESYPCLHLLFVNLFLDLKLIIFFFFWLHMNYTIIDQLFWQQSNFSGVAHLGNVLQWNKDEKNIKFH